MLTGYLAAEGFEDFIEKRCHPIATRLGRLIISEGPPRDIPFVQNTWYDVQKITFSSISDAANQLKSLGKLWAFYPEKLVRKGQLISEKLSYFSPKKLVFPCSVPKSMLGSWVLKDENTLYASAQCSSPFAHGEVFFHESKIPPSRAYLKLWEALTIAGDYPKKDEYCLEVGASPGGWTWVLDQLGTNVTAIDRAPLSKDISFSSRMQYLKKDAFTLSPQDFPNVDWLFSDVICYPSKLLDWVQLWLRERPQLKAVCTIKFQGHEDYEILQSFRQIPNSLVVHLFHNKHEMTWIHGL
ncbi:MAG: hypothetical protein EBZ47_01320 [Chlamydiae bacterium]|nr:hypothetical protein [Chlamydiota bacterium]